MIPSEAVRQTSRWRSSRTSQTSCPRRAGDTGCFSLNVKLGISAPAFLEGVCSIIRSHGVDRQKLFRCDFVGVGGRRVRETATQDASHHDGHWTCRKRGNLVLELRRSRKKLGPFLCKCAHALNANKRPLTFAKKMPEVCNFCQRSVGFVVDGSGDELSLIWKSRLCDAVKNGLSQRQCVGVFTK